MARVAGVDLPPNKRAQVGLTYIYGIGRSRATEILEKAQIGTDTKIRDLSEDELTRIRTIIDTEGDVEGDLAAARTLGDVAHFHHPGECASLCVNRTGSPPSGKSRRCGKPS